MALSLRRYTDDFDFSRDLNRILKERCVREREMSIKIQIGIGKHLPENVVVEILSWLPVKALLQFKCVCKSWYAIISSPHFVSKHLKNYYNNTGGACPLVQYCLSHAEIALIELLLDETPRILSYETLDEAPLRFRLYICGPCDGIYYVYDYSFRERHLWNPAINEYKVLPPVITKPSLPSHITYSVREWYGFGYDPVTNDYKVILIKNYENIEDEDSEFRCPSSVVIYLLRTDSWRYWGDLSNDYFLDRNTCYMALNGVLYWVGSCTTDENFEVVISFDMASDTVNEINVADYEKPAWKSLGIYHDSAALFCVHEVTRCFDIWALNDGVWTKSFTMEFIPGLSRPLGHCMSEDKVLLEGYNHHLLLCDLETQEVSDIGFVMHPGCHGIFMYKESLVSLKDRDRRGLHEEDETTTNQV